MRKKQKMMENIKDDEKIKDDGKRKTTKMEKIKKRRHVVKQMYERKKKGGRGHRYVMKKAGTREMHKPLIQIKS